jgi:hypothetical protein
LFFNPQLTAFVEGKEDCDPEAPGLYFPDAVRQGPFDPMAVTREYAALCKQYRIGSVTGDRYGKQWVQQAWRELLGTYNEASLYAWQLYLEVLAPFNRGLVELPEHLPLLREFKSLQRVASRTGKESVEHPRGSHDDLANAVAGCLQLLSKVEQKIPLVGALTYSRPSGWSDAAAKPRTAHQG